MLKNSANSLFLSSQISFSSIVLISALSCQSIFAEEINSIQDVLSSVITGNQEYEFSNTTSQNARLLGYTVYNKYEIRPGESASAPPPPGLTVISNITNTKDPHWSEALLQIDMRSYKRLKITIKYEKPLGWVTNLGSSSTNNGASGDSSTESLDSEMDVVGDTKSPPTPMPLSLRVFTDDYHSRTSSKIPNMIHSDGTSWVSYDIEPYYSNEHPSNNDYPPGIHSHWITKMTVYKGYLNPSEPVAVFNSDGIFNLDPELWDEEAGTKNDMQFWLGLNRVVCVDCMDYRSGKGATYVKIELWS